MERGYSKNTFARRGDCWKVNKNKQMRWEKGGGGCSYAYTNFRF